jgi:hypothetical protein
MLLLHLAALFLASAAPSPPPTLAITFQREDVATSDTVAGEVWIQNASAAPLDSLRLHLSGPAFISLARKTGGRCGLHSTVVDLPALPAGTLRHEALCLITGRELVEGDHTVTFSLTYRSRDSTGAYARAFVQATRTVKAGVFGNETIAGVSLRLASFLIPGLVFFILLRWMGTSTSNALQGTEVVTAAVVLSVLLIWLTGELVPVQNRRGMSIERFWGLCLAASALAAAAAALAAGVRGYRRRHLIWATDSDIRRFLRLLRALSARDATMRHWLGAPGQVVGTPVTVRGPDGQVLYGTVAEERASGEVRVLGWLRIGPVGDAALQKQLESLVQRKKWSRVASLVKEHRLNTTVQSAVHVLVNGVGNDTGGSLEVLVKSAQSVREGIHEGTLPANVQNQPVITVV